MAEEKKQAAFDVKLQASDLFAFNMNQTYTGFNGWVSIALSVLLFVMGVIAFKQGYFNNGFLYIAATLLVLFYMPVTLWTRAKVTVKKNEVLSGTLHFVIDGEGVHVTQGEESALLPWKQVYKMVGNHKRILIYSSRIHAYIIPGTQAAAVYDTIYELAAKNLPKYRFKLKK